jgi:1-deoxy-D-xylulose-5-phosphate synthase
LFVLPQEFSHQTQLFRLISVIHKNFYEISLVLQTCFFDMSEKNILPRINKPDDLKTLTREELKQLCSELRQFIIHEVAENPGHLGANLGVIELTVALHYVFDTPKETIVWDVGHQAYAHKILTGRKKHFHTNRKLHGISGFPKIHESPYDSFGTGHSSTSISAALGMAVADALKGNEATNHIVVIGDGGLTGGMSFEAMNHAGDINPNLLIIFNDNGIAIDRNVGAIKEYFAKITASKAYNRFKWRIWRLLRKTWFHKFINKLTTAIKSAILRQSNFFESLNFRYFGPIDGHNINDLIAVLSDLKVVAGPKVLHIITTKGKGFIKAEKEQTIYHAPGQYDAETGELIEKDCSTIQAQKYQTVFGKTLLELAEMNSSIVAITPAMLSGSSLTYMQHKFPERTFDVGIAEQHAVTFAAGLAHRGMIPFCTIYSTFLQRAYDQIIHDVALQKLPVVFCIDRAGIVGEDGPTHQGQFDLAFLRPIPNMIISAPIDEIELRNLMYTAQAKPSLPFAIRYPKGRGVHPDWKQPFRQLVIGKARLMSEGKDIAILSLGHAGNYVLEATTILGLENIEVQHYDMVFLKPVDEVVLRHVMTNYSVVMTVEDGSVKGGLASEVAEFISSHQFHVKHIPLGIPDTFIQQGSVEELHDILGMNTAHIVNTVKTNILKKTYYFCK